MNNEEGQPYKLAKEGALSNISLTKWLINLEERLRKIESSLSRYVTWEVSKAELAENQSENEE